MFAGTLTAKSTTTMAKGGVDIDTQPFHEPQSLTNSRRRLNSRKSLSGSPGAGLGLLSDGDVVLPEHPEAAKQVDQHCHAWMSSSRASLLIISASERLLRAGAV